MFKIDRKLSAAISQALCVLTFTALCAVAVLLPTILRTMIMVFGKPEYLFVPSLIILYIAIAPAAAAVASLFFLLRHVKSGRIFTPANVALIRLISWCCFCECAAFFSLGFYYITAFAVAFVFLFAGIVVRVFKNIIEEAVALKTENDLTI